MVPLLNGPGQVWEEEGTWQRRKTWSDRAKWEQELIPGLLIGGSAVTSALTVPRFAMMTVLYLGTPVRILIGPNGAIIRRKPLEVPPPKWTTLTVALLTLTFPLW